MSLKDELNKLIGSERALLEQRDAKNREVYELQKAQFRPLRSALEEMSEAVDPAYVRVEFSDSRATVEVGQHTNNHFHYDMRWEIAPSSKLRPLEPGEAFLETQVGFSIEETEKSLDDYKEAIYAFRTETEVVQHIVTRMTKRIAYYQHCESMRKHSGPQP